MNQVPIFGRQGDAGALMLALRREWLSMLTFGGVVAVCAFDYHNWSLSTRGAEFPWGIWACILAALGSICSLRVRRASVRAATAATLERGDDSTTSGSSQETFFEHRAG
jgi:hypothetical protein